jgi:hypothetical protein
MLRATAATVLFAFLCSSAAFAQTWSIGDEPFPTLLSGLPKAEQEAILKGLQPGIERRAKQFDLDEAEITVVKKELRIHKIMAKAEPLTLVQSYGIELCGAVGNCAVWALDKDNRLVLESGGIGIQILKTLHHGYPSILMFGHMSASQTYMTWYSFNGNQYVRVKCAVQTYSDRAQTNSPPRIDLRPCEK